MILKTHFAIIAVLLGVAPLFAQVPAPSSPRTPTARGTRGAQPAPKTTGDYTSDLAVVIEAQKDALEQARAMLEKNADTPDRATLETAVKQMEQAQTMLEAAKKSPEKLSAAVIAGQAAYQALLKAMPRDYNVRQSRNRSQGSASSSSQRNQRQLDQLDMKQEQNRYETERQATTPQTQQQREQLQTANRLKELAQRQQDLNERLKELQTALQEAKTQKERDEISRELKRLRDEERQMLADVDELRQKMEQSPDAASTAEARKQLEETRENMQRAAEQLDRESASQALAAGTRAQQGLQELRDDFRRQTSSQFAEQMRQLRTQARDLSQQQEELARGLESLDKSERKSLDDSAERQDLSQRMANQQNSLTNLLAGMRDVTEKAETTEPLLARQLYDTLRNTDQGRMENLLQMGGQLVDRGFIPQAREVERGARTNINQLRQAVERAAESVLGNETDALRYAQKELEDLQRQVEREIALAGTNAPGQTNLSRGALAQNNSSQRNAAGNRGEQNQQGQPGQRNGNSQSGEQASAQQAGDQQSPGGNPGEQPSNGQAPNGQNQSGQNPGQGSGNRPSDQQASGQQPGSQQGSGEQPSPQAGANGGGGRGNSPQGNSPGNRPGENQQQLADASTQPDSNNDSQPNGQGRTGGGGNNNRGGRGGGADNLRQLAEQFGNDGGNGGRGGPITGGNYLSWADRMRDVEQSLDAPELRNQIATVRERVGAMRAEYKKNLLLPQPELVDLQVLKPLTEVRTWVQQELSRREDKDTLVPLDRDPVPGKYSELVRRYYEKLGSDQ